MRAIFTRCMPSLESLGKNWDVIGGTLGIMIKECPRLSFHTQKHWFTGCSIKNAPPKSIKIRAFFVFSYIFLAKIRPRNPFPSKFGLIKNLFSSVLTKTCGKMLKMPLFHYYGGAFFMEHPVGPCLRMRHAIESHKRKKISLGRGSTVLLWKKLIF